MSTDLNLSPAMCDEEKCFGGSKVLDAKRSLIVVSKCTLVRDLYLFFNNWEHTILLNRKVVNKGMKRTCSLPLSPVVLTRLGFTAE